MNRRVWKMFISILLLAGLLFSAVSAQAGVVVNGITLTCSATLNESQILFSSSLTPKGINLPVLPTDDVIVENWAILVSADRESLLNGAPASGSSFFTQFLDSPIYCAVTPETQISAGMLNASVFWNTDLSQIKNINSETLTLSPNTTYYYLAQCSCNGREYSTEIQSVTTSSQINQVTWEQPYINGSGHFAAWAIYPKPTITIDRAGIYLSTDLNALLSFRDPHVYSSPNVFKKEDTDISSYSSSKGGTNFFYRKSYFDTPFAPGTTYYYMFYSWDSNGNYAYSNYSTYTVPSSGSGQLSYVQMYPTADQALTVGDKLTLTFSADQAVNWWRHIYNTGTGQDTCDKVVSSSASGSSEVTFNQAGTYRVYMGAEHPQGDMASNGIYVTVSERDTVRPAVVSASVGNITSTGYDVYVTASDNTGLSAIRIASWHDNMLFDDAVWQTQAPDAGGSATFRVRIQDFGFEQDVTYHTDVYAVDRAGNVSDAVRAGNPSVERETLYNLSVQCYGVPRSDPMPGYYSQVPANTEIHLSDMNFFLTDEENEELVFDRWSSSVGDEIFADPHDENTTFTMPECSVDVYKYYRHRTPVYSYVTFYATYGGTLYVYDAYMDDVYVVTDDQPCTVIACENDPFAVYAEGWDYYNFQSWETDDFWVQYTNEPGTHWITMPANDTWLCAVFEASPYVVDPSRAFWLPEGLTEIDEEAFAGVDATYFIVPDSVTYIGAHAFPADSVVYLSVSNIPGLPLNAIAQRGTYIDYEYTPDLEFAAAAAGTNYTVLNVYGKPFEEIWGDWSDWSETPVAADGRTQVETTIQYSYRDTIYETVYSDWSAWSGWTTTRQETSDLKREESTPLYIWYWYECPHCGANAATYGTCPSCGGSTAYGDYDIVLLPLTSNGAGTYASGSKRAYNDPDVGTVWYNTTDNAQYSYTGYRYSTRTVSQQPVTGEWSEYSETKPLEKTNREIRTRILYRYRAVIQ